MGLFDRFFGQDCPPVEPISFGPLEPVDGKLTRIEREHFVIRLPYTWKAVLGVNPGWDFRNQELPEQLTILVLAFEPRAGPDAVRAALEGLIQGPNLIMMDLRTPHAILSAPEFRTGPHEQQEARRVGYDKRNNLRAACVIRATPQKMVVFSLTRFHFEELGRKFEIYASIIWDFIEIK